MNQKYNLKTMDLKRLFTSLLFLLTFTAVSAQSDFVRGADVSWGTEMEASGRKFYTTSGQETELFALMKGIGMNTVRLRVWVNPLGYGYGAWCDKDDVVKKAERAQQQGLDVLIDFHYSDFFADPTRQEMPKDWSGYTFDQVKTAVADHTKDVLTALKQKGIEPKWVQVGNETNNGFIFDHGKIDWNKSGSARYTNYVTLSNAGYDAVKEVFPDAYVIVHIANAFEAADYDGWFYKEFKEAGGKFDMIGLSHYPDWNDWDSTKSGVASNTNAANSVKKLGDLFKVPVMIVETGFSVQDADKASQVMTDLFNKTKNLSQCAGIIYWEPETDGVWKPDYYTTVSWQPYKMGAFTTDGKPTATLDAFGDGSTAIHARPIANDNEPTQWYDLQGRQTSYPSKGLYIMKKGQETRKVILP
jgi:arabinogalactan endo-1,4-beta-galactosidase